MTTSPQSTQQVVQRAICEAEDPGGCKARESRCIQEENGRSCAYAEAARAASAAQDRWQTIETAPRDGTWILIWLPFHAGGGAQTVAQFDMAYTHADAPHELYRWRERGGNYNIIATHWKPLGEPPQ